MIHFSSRGTADALTAASTSGIRDAREAEQIKQAVLQGARAAERAKRAFDPYLAAREAACDVREQRGETLLGAPRAREREQLQARVVLQRVLEEREEDREEHDDDRLARHDFSERDREWIVHDQPHVRLVHATRDRHARGAATTSVCSASCATGSAPRPCGRPA